MLSTTTIKKVYEFALKERDRATNDKDEQFWSGYITAVILCFPDEIKRLSIKGGVK